MKIVKTICPNCGADLKVDSSFRKVTCEYCGSEFLVDDYVQPREPEPKEESRAYQETVTRADPFPSYESYAPAPQQRGCLRTVGLVCLWVFFFPIMLSIWIWKTDRIPNNKVKIAILIVFWLFWLGACAGSGSEEIAAHAPRILV